MDACLEPLQFYAQHLKGRHDQQVESFLDEAVKASGIDIAANRAQCAKIRELQTATASCKARVARLRRWGLFCSIVGWISVIVGPLAYCDVLEDLLGDLSAIRPFALPLAGIGLLLLTLYFAVLRKRHRAAKTMLEELCALLKQALQVAWAQLEPLNRRFDWQTMPRLLRAACPLLDLRPFLDTELFRRFTEAPGWNEEFCEERSIDSVLCGEFKGHPFLVANTKGFHWEMKTYKGELTIHWTTRERDSNGKSYTAHHSQTLVATVEKPIPVFDRRALALYRSDAAPHLSFSRAPSDLSGREDSFLTRFKKRRAVKKLEAFSRNLDDEYGFTMMENTEFETLFHATDRSDEVEFRLLFTPFAQEQMTRLLNDKEIGCGDDFSFIKRQTLSVLLPGHLDEFDLAPDPQRLVHYDYDALRANFLALNRQWAHALFFALAPFLAIPLYQQNDAPATPPPQNTPERRLAAWECEAVANWRDDAAFRPEQCVTEFLLDATVGEQNGITVATLHAEGFRTVRHTEYVSRYGRDGGWHNVPVEWLEYLPVSRERRMAFVEDACGEKAEQRLAALGEPFSAPDSSHGYLTALLD